MGTPEFINRQPPTRSPEEAITRRLEAQTLAQHIANKHTEQKRRVTTTPTEKFVPGSLDNTTRPISEIEEQNITKAWKSARTPRYMFY